MGSNLIIRPLADRLWAKVDRVAGPTMPGMTTPCWPWLGGCSTRRYGDHVYLRGVIRGEPPDRRRLLAHRVALILTTGEEPHGMDAIHRCDNTICCCPEHLYWGTHRENMRLYILKYGRLGTAKIPLPPRPTLPFDEPEPVPF